MARTPQNHGRTASGRLYVLDTGQKVHYERLKKHVPAPWDWTTHQPFGPDQNIALQCIDKLFLAILRKPRQGFAESMTRLRNSNLFDVCGI